LGPGGSPAPQAKHTPEVHQVMSGNRKGNAPGPGSAGVRIRRVVPDLRIALRGVTVTVEGGLQA
jgi:hypothetical protein